MLVLITKWFTRQERSRANTLLMLGNPITVLWMSIVTGYLIHSLGWQMTFIVEGLPSIVWAFLWLAIMRDKPSDAQWMSTEGSAALERRLAQEQLVLAPIRNWSQAFLRRDVLLLSVVYFCWSLGVYGFVLWLPTILRAGNGMGIEKTGLLSATPYLLAVILMLLASHFSDRSLRRTATIWPLLVIAGVSLFASFLATNHSFWIAYAALILAGGTMYAPYGSFFALVAESIPRNVLDEVLGLINSSGALGGFAGAWLVGLLQARTGDSRAGFLLMSGALIGSGLLMLGHRAKAFPAVASTSL
jgi:sugar phosphate permease